MKGRVAVVVFVVVLADVIVVAADGVGGVIGGPFVMLGTNLCGRCSALSMLLCESRTWLGSMELSAMLGMILLLIVQ